MLSTKVGFVTGVQQVNNHTLETDTDCLFQPCISLGAQWYFTNQAHPLSKLFIIYKF